jgi:hypothetical protein
MEHLFSPFTYFNDILVYEARPGEIEEDDLENFEMVKELKLDVSTEEFLSAERAFTYADLYTMLEDGDTVAWLTPDAYVMRAYGRAEKFCDFADENPVYFRINVDGKQLVVVRAQDPEEDIFDVVLRLLAKDAARSILFEDDIISIISAPSFAYLMEQCQSLKLLSVTGGFDDMDENDCRVLSAYSRPDLEINLIRCSLTSAGASALAEVLGTNQGPTKLDYCLIDNLILADGLRGNSRLKSLRLRIPGNLEIGNQAILEIAGALKENKGLVSLDLRCDLFRNFTMSNETWGAVCDSLKTHPRLEVLNLRAAIMHTNRTWPQIPAAVMNFRISAILGMLKMNTSIHTIRLEPQYYEHALYRESIVPYLETNRFRSRVLAIRKTHPMAYRTKVLGRALLVARTNVNGFWMLLSGNAEVALSSTTATNTPAANLPTPATATASAIAATSAVTTGPPTVNVAAPVFGQKRKASA